MMIVKYTIYVFNWHSMYFGCQKLFVVFFGNLEQNCVQNCMIAAYPVCTNADPNTNDPARLLEYFLKQHIIGHLFNFKKLFLF